MPDDPLADLFDPVDPSERVRRIAQRAQIAPDIADDYLKTTQIESGHNVNVRASSKGALGFGQVMPDVKGGSVRTVGGRQYNLKNPDENIEAGLRYFAEGGADPTSRRLYYFGGPRAKQHYERTGQIPNISDGNMTAAQYVKATGGQRPNKPVDPLADLFDQPEPSQQPAAPASPVTVKPLRRRVQAPTSGRKLFDLTPQEQAKLSGDMMGTGAAQARSATEAKQSLRGPVEALTRIGTAGLLPPSILAPDAVDYANEITAKGAAGLLKQGAGLARSIPHDPFQRNAVTEGAANKLNETANRLNRATQTIDRDANRGVVSQTAQDVAGGAIASAPAMILTRLGVPAPVAFGLQSYLEAEGRDAEFKDILKETGVGAAIGGLFEIPLPVKQGLLNEIGRRLTKAGLVGGGTEIIDKIAGNEPHGKNAAVNALFALSGGAERPELSRAERIASEPARTESSTAQGQANTPQSEANTIATQAGDLTSGRRGNAADIVSANAEQLSQPESVRHVDLQPRKIRGEGKGQFKSESRAETLARQTQVQAATPESGTAYHGTPRGALTELKPSSNGYFGPGVYISRDPGVAKTFSDLSYHSPTMEPRGDGTFQNINTGEILNPGAPKVLKVAYRDLNLKQITASEFDKEIESLRDKSGVLPLNYEALIQDRYVRQGYDGLDIPAEANFAEPQVVVFPHAVAKLSIASNLQGAATPPAQSDIVQPTESATSAPIKAPPTEGAPQAQSTPSLSTPTAVPEQGVSVPEGTVLYHGRRRAQDTVRPGSMLTNQPEWAAGYTTKVDPADLSEQFVGKVHEIPFTSKNSLEAKTLHDAEQLLISKATTVLGRAPSTLKEAAEAVHRDTGADAIIVKRDGAITDAISLIERPVSAKHNPEDVIARAQAQGARVPENLLRATSPQLEPKPTEAGAAEGVTATPVIPPDPYFTPEPATTAAKKASMGADREALDLPELPKAERKGWQQSLAAAKPERAGLLADEVLNKPRSLNDEETASLVVRAQEIKNEHSQVMKAIGDATDAETIQAKRSQADALEREFDRITRATKASGTEKGRTLAAQKLTINQDYDLVSLVQRAKAAKGRDLTPDERSRYEQQAQKITDLEQQLTEANDRAKSAQIQKQIGRIQRQTRRGETKAVLDDEFASLKAQLAQAKLETRSGVQPSLLAAIDPEGKLTPIIAKMARNRVKAGINSAEALVDEVYGAVKDHYDVSRDEIAQLIRGTLHQPDDVLSRWDKNRQTQLLKQQADLESRMATGNYAPKNPRQTPIYNRETFRLQKGVNELKAKFDREMYRANRSTAGKVADTVAGFGNIPKTMLSMADVSAVMRQGGIGVYQHPILSGRAGVDMLKAFTSHGFANVENAIKNSPRFDQAKRAGVEFTGVDKDSPQLSKHEEGYLGSSAIDTLAKGKVNPLRIVKGVKDFSERTFVSFLDSQRMRIFESQAKALEDMGLKGKDLDDALKSQAKYINIITGRGSLGTKGNQAAPALNVALFSPRLIASRVQFLNKMFNPGSWANTPKGARRLQMADNAKFLFGVASTLALAKAAGANVNLDPDDADFLKIKAGETRYDMLAGLQQPMRFMYRMSRAIKGGETYEGADKGKIAADFARSKAAPGFGYGWDYLEGKNRLSGKKFEAGKDLTRTLIPLPFQDFQEAIKQDGVVRGIAEAFPTLFGVGVQTYQSSPEKPVTRAEKLARKFLADQMSPDEGRTQEEIDQSQQLSELRAQSRKGIDVSKSLAALKSQGVINDRKEKSILSSRGQMRLQEDVKRLPLYDPKHHKDALTVYSTATLEQQEALKKIISEKAAAVDLLPLEQQKEVRDRLISYGFKPGLSIPKRPERPQRPERPNPRAWSYQQ